jgi:hypothetical protein
LKTIALILTLLVSGVLYSQNDTLIVANNYKFKVGVKGLYEKSGIPAFTPETKPVYNYGVQVIYKLGNSISSIESGIYHFTRSFDTQYKEIASSYYTLNRIAFKNIHIPLNYRIDTKITYFSFGVYADYLYSINADNLSEYMKEGFVNKKINFGYDINIGIEKAISSQFSFFVEAESSVGLTSIHNKGEAKLVNYGVAIGVNYKILK